MISPHMYLALATARHNDLLAEARAARLAHLAREARGDRHPRIETWTRRHPKLSPRGRTARRTRGTGRPEPRRPEVTS